MEKFRFLVVVPTLNAADTIVATLDSLRILRKAGVGIVVVDSFSADGTIKIVESWGLAKLLQIEPGNMYAAINHGLTSVSDWEWATYINADDILFPDQTLSLLAGLGDKGDLVYGNIDYIDHCGRYLHSFRSPSPKLLKGIFASGINPIPQQGSWFSRRTYDSIGGFRTKFKYSSDFDFFLRTVVANGIISRHRSGTVAAFRLHRNQLSHKFFSKMATETETSLIDSRLSVSRFNILLSYTLFKARNTDQYICRYMRRVQLTGKFKVPKTMSV
jgi:glycosyltransferase involved in cell wall biosynthesis